MQATESKEVDGVHVFPTKCSHCGAEPSEEDLRDALRKAKERRASPQSRCAYCGDPIECCLYTMHHDESGWVAWEVEIEPCISLEILPQKRGRIDDRNGLHERCVKKALPFVNGLEAK